VRNGFVAPARPKFKRAVGNVREPATLAAACGFGLIRNHPYRDGNKRVCFQAMVAFLGINGLDLETDDADVVKEMIGVAAGHVSEEALAKWIQARVPGKP